MFSVRGLTWSAGSSVYGPEAKRRKTEDERKAEEEKRRQREELAAAADPTAEWVIEQRQPWADKQVAPAKPTDEQLLWLKEEGFIKEEEEEGEDGKVYFVLLSCAPNSMS